MPISSSEFMFSSLSFWDSIDMLDIILQVTGAFCFSFSLFSCSREGKSPVKKIVEWVHLIVSCVPWGSGPPPPQKAFRSRLYVLITLFTPFPYLSLHCPITVNKNMFAGTSFHTGNPNQKVILRKIFQIRCLNCQVIGM